MKETIDTTIKLDLSKHDDIPKIIHVSWKTKYILLNESPIILNGLANLKKINPDYELEISDDELMLHERVYNMASPAGLASSLAVPVFDGYYTGNVANLSIFSIPAVPGSSGSPIMTEDNRVVSLVSAAAIKFDEYAIGPQTRAIREFLLANLPD